MTTPSKASGENHLSTATSAPCTGYDAIGRFLCAKCGDRIPPGPLASLGEGWLCEGCMGKNRPAFGVDVRVRKAQAKKPEPVFDTDIRVGDVVEVVSIDDTVTPKSGEVGARGRVLYVNEYMTPPPHRTFYTVVLEGVDGYVHGRFRVIEREGKAYGRNEDKTLRVLLDTADRVDAVENARRDASPCPDESGRGRCDGCEACGEKRDTQLAVSSRDPICNWCSKPITDTDPDAAPWPDVVHLHGECFPYWSALEKRVKGGAYDIPEERESVRRFVDAQLDKASCPPPSDDGGALPYQPIDERIREARLSSEVDPVSGWSAWATAGDES
jgi:hypothetical protein